jgi:hypothetical protein
MLVQGWVHPPPALEESGPTRQPRACCAVEIRSALRAHVRSDLVIIFD